MSDLKADVNKLSKQILLLKKQLSTCIDKQDYELAAQLRDDIEKKQEELLEMLSK